MKTKKHFFLILLFSILIILESNAQNQASTNKKGSMNLSLYAAGGIASYKLSNLPQAIHFGNGVETNYSVNNLGAGFTNSFGKRFSIGADYLFGLSKKANDNQIIEVLSFETPIFVEYKALIINGFSIAPQLGINYGFVRLSYSDKLASPITLNSYSIKQSYLALRAGLSFELAFKNNMVLGIKSGYDFNPKGETSWLTQTSATDTGIMDKMDHLYVEIMFGTKLSIK